MAKPKIHVAFLGKLKNIEHIAVRRRIDELILIHTSNQDDDADSLIDKFANLGVKVSPVRVVPNDFTNILSLTLNALDSQKFDQYDIEFSISSKNCTMTLAACICAMIVKASILFVWGNEIFNISEVWPSEIVNLTHQRREILSCLQNYGKPVHQKEMAEETGIRQSGLSRHLRNLELAGYVTRSRIDRYKHVQITELGCAILHHKQIRKRRIWCSYAPHMPKKIQTVG
ncbi:MAG: MarR family winged helix-turn-helix transcriptional regulator [Candidatus Thorarchaeota archaeon]|jgi:DNA-binding MarR family transcriptional regulator